MHADYIAFTERNNLKIFSLAVAARFPDHALQNDCRPRWRIFLVRVMALEYLSSVFVRQGSSRRACGVEKNVHANGEVRRVNKTGAVTLDQLPDAVQFFMPTCSTHDHILPGVDAGLNVTDDRGGSSEINHDRYFA